MKKLFTGLVLLVTGLAGFAQGTPTLRFNTYSDLTNYNIPSINASLSALVTGRATTNDGAGGVFFYSTNATDVVDNGIVFKPAIANGRWIRQTKYPVNNAWYGLPDTLTGYTASNVVAQAFALTNLTTLNGTNLNTLFAPSFAVGLGLTNNAGTLSNNIVAGGNITLTAGANGQLSIAAGTGGATGGVSSVNATVPAFLAVSGVPITTSGTIAISLSGTPIPTNTVTGNYVGIQQVGVLTNGLSVTGSGLTVNDTIHISANDIGSTFIGFNSGQSNTVPSLTNGINNTFTGAYSGADNVNGYANSFYGFSSGGQNTSGSRNVFLSYQAGLSNTIGNNNIFIGVDAGYGNVDSDGSIIIGFHSGIGLNPGPGTAENTIVGIESNVDTGGTGTLNSLFGYRVGYHNTSGFANSSFGTLAGFSNTSGYRNTELGYQAGFSNQSGVQNVFLGQCAGYYQTGSSTLIIDNLLRANAAAELTNALISGTFGSGESNQSLRLNASVYTGPLTANGANVNSTGLTVNTNLHIWANAADSTFIGKLAGLSNLVSTTTNGIDNTFIGSVAGSNNTNGYALTFVGKASGSANVTGNRNTALGALSGSANIAGSDNVTIGYNAGAANTNSDGSVIIGSGAGYLLKPASGIAGNTVVGKEANFVASTGTLNSLLGYRSGFNISSGFANTYLGYLSGFGTTTGQRNVYAGYQAGFSNQSGVANVFIGQDAGYYETGSSKLFIDNALRANETDARTNALIYGVFGTGVGNQTLALNAAVTTGPLTSTGTGFNGAGTGLTGTATSLNIGGSAASLSANLPVSKLNSGTGASSTTFWRGDGTWGTPAGSGGTVTSVAMSVPAFLSVSGSPVTSSGTLAVSLSGTALPVANGGTGGTSASAARTALSAQTQGPSLDGINGLTGFGILALDADTGSPFLRTLTAGSGISISNGDGLSGNPTISATSGTLPSQTGNAGKLLVTDGTNAAWANTITNNTVTIFDPTTGGTGFATLNLSVPDVGLDVNIGSEVPGVSDFAIQNNTSGANLALSVNPGVGGEKAIVLSGSTLETDFPGDIVMVPGAAIQIQHGSNQRAGNATLVGGTVTVSNTSVTANTIVMLTRKTSGGTIGDLTYTVSAATSFTINSVSALDTSTVSYLLIEVP